MISSIASGRFRLIWTVVAVPAFMGPCVAFAQTVARAEFEVASIRPPNPNGDRGTNISTNGGTLRIHNATLRFCIVVAYGIQDSLIDGGPSWINSDQYEIVAKIGDSAGNARFQPMLQALLENRFKLKTHLEMKQRPVYALSVTKNGPRLHASNSSESFLGRRGKGPITGRKATMTELAATLSTLMGRKVLDQTGIGGEYDFTLEFAAPDEVDSPLPALVTALQEQLGLRLEATTGLVEVLVVDHAEKWSWNDGAGPRLWP